MSEMIERVARVLCRFTWEAQFGKQQDLDACVDQEWPNHTDAARLSIKAMREPTKEMLFVGSNDEAGFTARNLQQSWYLMIEEALR